MCGKSFCIRSCHLVVLSLPTYEYRTWRISHTTMKGRTKADVQIQAFSQGDDVISQPSRASAELGQTSEDNALSMGNVIGNKIVATLGTWDYAWRYCFSLPPFFFLFSATCKAVLVHSFISRLKCEMRRKSPRISFLGCCVFYFANDRAFKHAYRSYRATEGQH